MPGDDSPESVTLECQKTGREYDAPVTIENDEATVDMSCPYCENRGVQAAVDDLRRDLEDLKRRVERGDDVE